MTFVLIDNSLDGKNDCCLFERPIEIVQALCPADVPGAVARLEEVLAAGRYAAGYFSYELGYQLEPRLQPLLPERRDVPLLWFGVFDDVVQMSARAAGNWLNARAGAYDVHDFRPNIDKSAYLKSFARAREMIASGDIYQVNLTFKSAFQLEGCPIALYCDLRAKQPTRHGVFIDGDEFSILSLSPELFLARQGEMIETRPMKGTASRGKNEAADKLARRALVDDDKQRAENLMIVDLMRNDLGRISEIGSVSVNDLFKVETYPTLHQMTTSVRARLRKDLGLMELLQALFPPGSITGAPKIRAMELIREFEPEPRGVYTGAIGMIGPDSTMNFNVAIRTAVISTEGRGEIGIGSGVVADSNGDHEFAECLLKSKFFTDPVQDFQLIETMLYDGNAGVWLLDEHIARLSKSASHFGISIDDIHIRKKLERYLHGGGRQGQRLRVRLLLGFDGQFELTSVQQPGTDSDNAIQYVLSPTRLNSKNIYLQHKTTRRQLFDDEFAIYSAKGADEVIYSNERGELTEGSRTSIFLQVDGKLHTPPLVCGLLPGTLRAHLLALGTAIEKVLQPVDLARAEALYLGNSVRGLQLAQPLGPSTGA